jgi:hypothetical protein
MPHYFHIFLPASPRARKISAEWPEVILQIWLWRKLDSAAIKAKCNQLNEESLGDLESLLDIEFANVQDAMQRTAAGCWAPTGQKKRWFPTL